MEVTITMSATTTTMAELPTLVGRPLGPSRWLLADQDRINGFADVTEDHQWIHVDPERAKDGPFGITIAHGYLTLALLIPLWYELLEVSDATSLVNYGLNSVRFPAPVPAGSRIRLQATLASVDEVRGGGLQVVVDAVIEVEGSDKPVCVAKPVFRFYA
jgi:acyl dehydratase